MPSYEQNDTTENEGRVGTAHHSNSDDPNDGPESLSDSLSHLRGAFLSSLYLSLAEAVTRVGEAAAGQSTFQNDREFKAALRLLDLVPMVLLNNTFEKEQI